MPREYRIWHGDALVCNVNKHLLYTCGTAGPSKLFEPFKDATGKKADDIGSVLVPGILVPHPGSGSGGFSFTPSKAMWCSRNGQFLLDCSFASG